MERGYEMSIYSSQTAIRATADSDSTPADRTATPAGNTGTPASGTGTLTDRTATPAGSTGRLADRAGRLAGSGRLNDRAGTLADRAADPPSPAEPVAHHLRLDDHRCGCGLPREECVRQRIRALWTI